MAIAATVLLGVSGLIAYQLGHLRLTTASQDAYNASVAGEVASIMRAWTLVGCAVGTSRSWLSKLFSPMSAGALPSNTNGPG